MNSKFSIEENWHDGDPLDEEIASYIVRDSNERQILVVEAHVTFDEGLDSLVVNRISIPVDPDVNGLDVPTKRMADILAALAKEDIIKPGEAVHLDMPGEYNLRLEEPYKITFCYYQRGYDTEIDRWLTGYLERNGSIAKVLEVLESNGES